jgi:hypothetical protein
MRRYNQMDASDLVLALFALICVWIATEMSGGGGGGLRKRVLAPTRS